MLTIKDSEPDSAKAKARTHYSNGALSREFFLYLIGGFGARLITVLLIPIFTHFIRPSDYGVGALVTMFSSFLTGLFSLGLTVSMPLLFTSGRNESERHSVVWTSVVLLSGYGMLLVVAGLLVAPTISQLLFHNVIHSRLISLAIFTLAFNTANFPCLAYLRLNQNAKHFTYFSLVNSLLLLTLSAFLIGFMGRGVLGMFEAMLFTEIISFLLSIVFILSHLRWGFRISYARELITLGFPTIFGWLSYFVVDYSARWIIEIYGGTREVGIYALGSNIGMVALTIVTAFGYAWSPYYLSFTERIEDAKTAFGKVFLYYIFSFGTFALLFLSFARPVIYFISSSEYYRAYTVVGLVALSYVIRGCYWIFHAGYYLTRRVHIPPLLEWGCAILSIPINIVLIQTMGIIGAAIGLLCTQIILTASTFIMGKSILTVAYPWPRIHRFLSLFGLFFLISTLLHLTALETDTMLHIVMLIMFCFVLYARLLQNDERIWIRSKLKYLLQRN